jgi:succinate-semialdehyde dehydrogenase/glutarate-semialdehyde dehydrogenase
MKPASMELGGHSPVLVFEDADIEQTAETLARGKFRNNGQVCIAASRIFVQSSVAERFTERFVEVVRGLKLGNGHDPQTDVGPLANRRRLDAIEGLVADAVDKGATVCCGGRRPEGFDRGFFYEPTVLQNTRPEMKLMFEEPFGPVAPISSFDNLDEAIERANDTPFGLAGYVFTNNLRTAHLASERLECGMVGVNNLVIATAEAPFGGIKQSGFGREGGFEWADAYTVTKYINMLL